ncbi:MAG TPA: glutamate-5-semialdehyde dehydrogenase [Polyangia bacterium]|nr:glutamate-5-semialdehyde dehydrogenase [Polyangia bacterium]
MSEGSSKFTQEAALAAKAAGAALRDAPAETRSALLRELAEALGRPAVQAAVFAANARDIERSKADIAQGTMSPDLIKRLALDPKKLAAVSDGLLQLAAMTDLVGRVTLRRELDTGLILERVTCPLGLMGVVFEARPDALVQIVGLALRTGNAVLLKGGREAQESNRALAAVVHEVLSARGLDPRAAVLLEDRADVSAVLSLDGIVDLIVARGSSQFVNHVRASTRIPVMAHAAGICHLYLHRAAEPAMAARLAVDSKMTYPAACNALETLLWDEGAEAALDASIAALLAAGVELRGCPATRARHPQVVAAPDDAWDTEYGAPILSVRRVRDLDEALAHIQRHGSRHTDSIVTADAAAATKFLTSVDSAGVYHNASTRFSDGYRYGLGAEVGISTDKLHARGPVGVDGLLTYRWLLHGNGHLTADYGAGGKRFTHRDL